MAYSLSWFKKRVAALNKEYGTKYSPTALHNIYLQTGNVSGVIRNLPDPRARGVPQSGAYRIAAANINRITFQNLASANNYVNAILNAQDGFISPSGRVVYYWDGVGNLISQDTKSGAIRVIEKLPQNAIPLTPKEARRRITSKAKEIHAQTRNHPARGYRTL